MAYRKITEDESTKDLLVRAASELLRRKGSDFSVREVCAEAGVSVGTFYTYFKNKSELILQRLNRRDQMLREALAAREPEGPKERLRFICRYYAEYNLMRGVVSCRDVYANMQMCPITAEKESETYLYESILQIMTEGRQTGVFRAEVDPRAGTDTVLCFLRGLGYNWCYYDGENYDLIAHAEAGISMILDGLCTNSIIS